MISDSNANKQNLWKIVDENSEELLSICSKLIQIPSVNPGGSVENVVKLICSYFDSWGIEYKIVSSREDCPNIIAEIGNGEEYTLLLNGHCDVVPPGDLNGWNFYPFSGEIVDGKMLGRGTSDMKCGLGGLLFVVKTIKENNMNFKGKIVFHIVPDEETGGLYGTKWLQENGYMDNADACIVAEPTSYSNCEVGQKGNLIVKLKAYGSPAHGSIGNYKGENAIMKMSKILEKLHKIREIEGKFDENQLSVLEDSKDIARKALKVEGIENVIDHVTVNVGTIKGGTKINVVPDYCEANLDIRIPIGVTVKEVLNEIDNIIIESGLKNIDYTYSSTGEASFTSVDTPLVKSVVDNAQQIWNKKVVAAYQWASSDAKFYRAKNIPTIQYGPANTEGIHAYNEDVDVIDIINSTKVYFGIMADLLDLHI